MDLFIFLQAQKEGWGLSRTSIQKLIQGKKISSSTRILLKPHQKVKTGEMFTVSIDSPRQESLVPEAIALEVMYEDMDLAIINKPSGLVVHPAPGNYTHTLVHALLHRFKELSDINPLRPGIVHRLDKETSGLLVVAKNNVTHLALSKLFASHTITRKYVAVVEGNVAFDENIIELPIGRHPVKRKKMSVSFGKNMKYAKTRYRTISRAQEYSVLELTPFTGRTHQLRAHLAFINHPIVGDSKYGRQTKESRLYLHAYLLGFLHPVSGKYMEFTCRIPEEFRHYLSLKECKALENIP